jgi:hypothetical protein
MSFEDQINEHFVKGAGPYSIAINSIAKIASRAKENEKAKAITKKQESLSKEDDDALVL